MSLDTTEGESLTSTPAAEPVAPEPSPAPEAPADKPTLDELLSDAYDKATRPAADRDPQGRFIGKPGSEPSPQITRQVSDQAPPQETVKPAPPAIQPPVSWSAEEKAAWPSLPSPAQHAIARREQEATAKISEQGRRIAAYEPVANTLEQHREHFEQYGLSYEEGITALLSASRKLEQNPIAGIQALAEQYGVDLRMFAGQGGQGQGSATDPRDQQIASLARQLNEVTEHLSARERHEGTQKLHSASSLIDAFAKDKPDWADIEADLPDLVVAIKAAEPDLSPDKILDKAYDRARWANPATRQKLIEETARKKDEERLAKERDEKNGRAQRINVKSSPGTPPTKRNLDDILSSKFDEMQRR